MFLSLQYVENRVQAAALLKSALDFSQTSAKQHSPNQRPSNKMKAHQKPTTLYYSALLKVLLAALLYATYSSLT